MKQDKQASNKSKVNNSKAIETHDKESIKALFSRIRDIFRLIFLKYSFVKRLVSLTVIFALLMPFVLLGNFSFVSAQSISPSSLIGNISTPSFAYDFGIDKSLNFSPALAMQNSTAAVSAYVTAPTLPKGFESASPVSPLYRDFSSVSASAFSTVGSFFGFFVNPIVSEESESAELSESSELSENTVSDGAFPNGAKPFDLNGDGKANVSSWNPSNGEWKTMDNSGNLLASETLGNSSSLVIPGDFDNDNITDKAVWTNGLWTIKKSSDGTTVTHSFGTSGDIPVAGDYDGDGKSDYAVFRPSTNTWWIQQSSNNAITSTGFGASGDIPIQGDYDGDNETDIAIFRPSTGDWHISASTAGYYAFHWGLNGDTPIPADFNNDNKTDYGIYRPTTGTWYIYYSDGTTPYTAETWGNYGDQPVAADYDGDGKADLSVWRPKTGLWLIKLSNTGTYRYETLGINSDTPIPAAYVQKISGSVPDYNFAKLRLAPINSTGGTDLYSRNFSWGTGLVGLSGRSGLSAGFGISYNSLVWLKDDNNNTITFDPDYSNVTPGFNFGYSRIEPVYWDKNNGRFSYIMVTSSGARVEFHQIGATDTYETADSSYVQLKTNNATNPNDPVENITITVRGTDGTKMEYEWKAGAFRAKEIKDRNGNYITINHDDRGLLKTVTDTLGRIITVNYDAELYPTTITQDWKTNNGAGSTTSHTYATFSYTNKTIATSFDSSLTVFGPPSGTSIKVLDKITSASGAYTQFEYNNYAQVWKVNNHAIDGHKLNHTSVNIGNPTTNQTDVPRFSETRSFVENFNSGNEIIISNEFLENQSIPSPGSGTGTRIKVWMTNHPTSNESRTYVGDSGWQEALPLVTEDYADEGSGLTRKRWSWTNWTQDDTSLSYIKNPRTTESKVGDDENNFVRRTTTDYKLLPNTTIAEYGLVDDVKIYDADQTTVLRKVETDYNLNIVYVDKRIIGLPSETRSYGMENSSLTLISKSTYNYDEGNFSDSSLEQTITPIQHDATNFGASFIIGRGNLTSTTRHDVTGTTSSVTSSVKYNTAGSPVAGISLDSVGNDRIVKTSYVDKFNDSPTNKNTYAYLTKIITPSANNTGDIFSEVEYRYDIGANVWAESPGPNGSGTGKETTRTYDSLGRLDKQTLVNTGAYTRYDYPNSGTNSKVYSTITDTNGNNTGDSADEVLSETWLDGAGRVLKTRSLHPNGGNRFIGSFVEYNILGQVKRSTVPTEVSSSGNPTGDDSAFLWKQNEYDWNGRITREINTDGTDRIFSYTGCGCAGGQITTIKGEQLSEGRRTIKYYQDILGRKYMSEVLNWDNSVYSSTVTQFSGRDQAINIKQYEGSSIGGGIFQEGIMSYDGHGRLKTIHRPRQDSGTNTTYNYNIDDSISTVTDARGAVETRSYNSVGLLNQIGYSVPTGSTIPVTPTISFTYDKIGNRTQMTDETGTKSYQYDSLSRLTSETKQFALLSSDNGMPSSVTIGYDYDFSRLKKITYPNGEQIAYTYHKSGDQSVVDGFGFTGNNGQSAITSNYQYRAWGAVKHITYANGRSINLTYNNRLKPKTYEVTGITTKNYQYTNDGLVKYVSDTDNRHDREYLYDQMGRLKGVESGRLARNEPADYWDVPLLEHTEYNAFGNTLQKVIRNWGSYNGSVAEYTNNRITNRVLGSQTPLAREYDAEGNVVISATLRSVLNTSVVDTTNYKVDSSGNTVVGETIRAGDSSGLEKHFKFDGDGRNVIQREDHDSWTMTYPKKYEVWSSVFGKPLIQYEGDWSGGQWNISLTRLNIYDANGTKIAVGPYLRWENIAPSNTAVITVNEDPLGQQIRRSELTSLGSEISFEPSEPPDENEQPESLPEMGSIESEANQICSLNGLDIQCSQVSYIMGSGECEYASCHIKDSHGDYIFDPEVEIGPASPSKSICNGLSPEEREICYYHVRQNLDVQKKALRDKLEGAIQQESLRRLLDDIKQKVTIVPVPKDIDLIKGVEALLNNTICKNFISEVLKEALKLVDGSELAFKGNQITILNEISKTNRIITVLNGEGRVGGYFSGAFKRKNATIAIVRQSFNLEGASKRLREKVIKEAIVSYSVVALQESVHASLYAGGFKDSILAQAVDKASKKRFKGLPVRKKDESSSAFESRSSLWGHMRISSYCDPNFSRVLETN